MSRSRTLLLSAILLVNPVLLAAPQEATQDFNMFFVTFKTAVEQKDTATLASLMSPRFDFIFATNVAQDDVFSGLNSNDDQQWINLLQAVQGTPVGTYRKSRVLQCTADEVIYKCQVVFNKDSRNRWRWRAMVMLTQ